MGKWEDESTEETIIHENGSLPSNVEDLTEAEICHYLNIVVTALRDLDIETLKIYTQEEDNIETLQAIANDSVMRMLWEETMGQMIYLQDSNYIVYKNMGYISLKWYNDMLEQGVELPDSNWELSEEELLNIFNTYKDEAPYSFSLCMDGNICDVEDGKIYFYLDRILVCAQGFTFIAIEPEDGEFGSSEYIYMIHGGSLYLDNEIALDEKETLQDVALKADLNEVFRYYEEYPEHEIHTATDDIYAECYHTDLKNDEKRAKIQQWMDENVEVYNGGSRVYFYAPADNIEFLTYEELELIKNLRVVDDIIVYEEEGDIYDFSPYYELINHYYEE